MGYHWSYIGNGLHLVWAINLVMGFCVALILYLVIGNHSPGYVIGNARIDGHHFGNGHTRWALGIFICRVVKSLKKKCHRYLQLVLTYLIWHSIGTQFALMLNIPFLPHCLMRMRYWLLIWTRLRRIDQLLWDLRLSTLFQPYIIWKQ